jgi:hypothetical protein
MRRSAISEESVECLLPIANMPSLDQGIGDMWAADRGARANLRHDLRFTDRHTKGGQFRKNTSQPTQPAIANSGHLGGQARTTRISAVRQDVHAAATTRARELHPAYHNDANPLPLGCCLIKAIECIVVGQRNDIERCLSSLSYQLGRRIRPIGHQRVSMQVDPHNHRPITLR